MRILIEEYQYAYEDVSHLAPSLDIQHDAEGKVSLSRVGYFFCPEVDDCVFVLPKVLLEGEFGQELVFGHIPPRDLIVLDKCEKLTTTEREFIYNLSVWIYRAICVFKEHEYDRFGGKKKTPSIVLYKQMPVAGHSRKRKANTFLDILLALQQWNRDNQQFVMFIVKNLHAGYNKINWTRTISHSQAIIQNEYSSQSVVYLNPVNRKRTINFDEELLVIYYSILYYINDTYGLPVIMNVNFPLIKGEKFKTYLKGFGVRRLRQIKYKYFSDKALELWNLCFDFFDRPSHVTMNVDRREYLMVKSFHVVFEAIIDELIAGDQKLPKELIDQEDGKVVDHMYQYRELVNDESDEEIYYIGDSKYYKRGRNLSKESIYKQFTYARNVVQWNIDLFNDGNVIDQRGHIKLRDEVTEGYNVIPNFFISAQQNELEKKDDIHLTTDKTPYHLSRQFENRLFDRDTFLLAHYDVNFLFVLALYGRNKESAKVAWRNKARLLFRSQIQEMLKEHFTFYAMTAHEDVDAELYVKEHFQSVLGKVFRPFDNKDDQQYFSLALRKPERIELTDKTKEADLRAEVRDENEALLFQLRQNFYVELCPLGELPYDKLPVVVPHARMEIPKKFMTMHYLENYPNTSFLIGAVNGENHIRWILGREGGKRDDAYNVRIGKDVHGGVVKSRDEIKHAKFVILYIIGREHNEVYKVFRVKNIGEMSKAQMIKTGYHDPNHDRYLCYFFDEEVTLGNINIDKIIEDDRKGFMEDTRYNHVLEEYPQGRPIYLDGNQLIAYRY